MTEKLSIDNGPEKPYIGHKSVGFSLVKGATLGAVIGSAFSAISGMHGAGGKPWSEAALSGITTNKAVIGSTAIITGIMAASGAIDVNHERKRVRPYVERLEKENDLLAHAITTMNR